MSSVRRLSKGSNVSLMDFESDDDLSNENEFGSKGINAMTKRRSSMGGGSRSKLNPTEQTRIADMYKTVIKLAAENVSINNDTLPCKWQHRGSYA